MFSSYISTYTSGRPENPTNILPRVIFRHPLSENEKFCYKPQNNPSVTILLNWVDSFQMNNLMLPS